MTVSSSTGVRVSFLFFGFGFGGSNGGVSFLFFGFGFGFGFGGSNGGVSFSFLEWFFFRRGRSGRWWFAYNRRFDVYDLFTHFFAKALCDLLGQTT